MAPLAAIPVKYLTSAAEDRAFDVQLMLADKGMHRGPSVPDLIVAATAELGGLTVLHLDKHFDLTAGITGQPVGDWPHGKPVAHLKKQRHRPASGPRRTVTSRPYPCRGAVKRPGALVLEDAGGVAVDCGSGSSTHGDAVNCAEPLARLRYSGSNHNADIGGSTSTADAGRPCHGSSVASTPPRLPTPEPL